MAEKIYFDLAKERFKEWKNGLSSKTMINVEGSMWRYKTCIHIFTQIDVCV